MITSRKDEAYLPRAWLAHESRVGIGIGGSGSGNIYRVDVVGRWPWGENKYESVTIHSFDVRRSDRAYWVQVKVFLRWLAASLSAGSRDWAHFAYKELRRQHHATKRREWDDVLPREIVDWANRKLAESSEGEMCVDNYRVAQIGNTGQMRRYKAAHKDGCCGFADFKERGPDGKMYLLGYNYGH